MHGFSVLVGTRHLRPRDGRECQYLADQFCNKCGWLHPTSFERPSTLASFTIGVVLGSFVTALFLLVLFGG